MDLHAKTSSLKNVGNLNAEAFIISQTMGGNKAMPDDQFKGRWMVVLGEPVHPAASNRINTLVSKRIP